MGTITSRRTHVHLIDIDFEASEEFDIRPNRETAFHTADSIKLNLLPEYKDRYLAIVRCRERDPEKCLIMWGMPSREASDRHTNTPISARMIPDPSWNYRRGRDNGAVLYEIGGGTYHPEVTYDELRVWKQNTWEAAGGDGPFKEFL
jgi:hypothetical protein